GSGPAETSRTALADLIGGKSLALRRAVRPGSRDTRRLFHRHSLISGHLFVVSGEAVRSVQAALLAMGQARTAASIEDTYGVGSSADKWGEKFIAAERSARTAKLGLWRNPGYEVRRGEDPAGLLGERGRFTLIEGKVVSVRESGGTIYVNFGR